MENKTEIVSGASQDLRLLKRIGSAVLPTEMRPGLDIGVAEGGRGFGL